MHEEKKIREDFAESLRSQFGREEAEALLASLSGCPSVSVRINRSKADDREGFIGHFADFSPSRVPWSSSGFYLSARPDFILDPLLHAGVYYVQEAASMVYESIVDELLPEMQPNNGNSLKVLDLCAAPGGKTTAMLNSLSNFFSKDKEGNYVMVANEYERARAGILRENLNKWGDPNVIITSTNASTMGRMENFFDIIAVDAPCSGEGMMRREPMACSQWSPQLVEQCAALQKEILADILPALLPGGYLIFSTCTFNTTENEDNCNFIVRELGLTQTGVSRRFMPHREQCEGLFVALFQKPLDGDPASVSNHRKLKPGKNSKNAGVRVPQKDIYFNSKDFEFVEIGDRICALPPAAASVFNALASKGIKPLSAGVEAGTMKGNLFVPSSRQVLSSVFDGNLIPVVPLSRDEAVEYLRRAPLVLPQETPRGYVCVSYEGFPLGIVKNIGSRANNLYPQEWKILKR